MAAGGDGEVPGATALRDAVNLSPHDILVYEYDRKTVRHVFKSSGPSLRLEEGAKRKTVWLKAAPGVKVPCNLGGAQHSGLNRAVPEGPVIVSDLVARYLVEHGFKYAIFTPDTNPASSVRDSEGKIVGVLRMTIVSAGAV